MTIVIKGGGQNARNGIIFFTRNGIMLCNDHSNDINVT